MNVNLPKNFTRKRLFHHNAQEQHQSWEPPTIDNSVELTLLDAIEQIATLAHHSELCSEFYKQAQRPIEYLSERMGLSTDEVVFFATVFNMYYDHQITQQDIGRYLNIPPLYLLRFMTNIDELLRRRIVRCSSSMGSKCYYLPASTISDVIQDTIPQYSLNVNLTLEEWFAELNVIIDERKSKDCHYDEMVLNIASLIETNNHLQFVQSLDSYKLRPEDTAMFLWCCDMVVNDRVKDFEVDDLWQLIRDRGKLIRLRGSLRSGTNPLVKQGLIQPVQDAIMIKDRYELSEMVINEMMQGLNLHLKREQIDELIDFEAIQYKPMFYNPKEKDAIESLTELLGPKRYSEVCQRLEERGMRKGVACLFYGGPGTGKTETVLQLAKATGRCLMQVNISDIKSKWVGDSEKNVKKIFSHYKELVKKMDVTPILFFNEADAIINKRMENAQRSVDKMENSMQNIILQEIENLDGILIATTNLTQNLDKAFERRFLYKIEFSKPSLEAKSMIWQSMIPELSTTDAQTLAQSYDFSGGQIENIARKQIVDNIITGVPLSIDKLRQHCDTELLDKKTIRRAIGF